MRHANDNSVSRITLRQWEIVAVLVLVAALALGAISLATYLFMLWMVSHPASA
jgi:hypothetical protein